jgi:hypothetical protein
VGAVEGGARVTLRGQGLEGFIRATIAGRDIEGARLLTDGAIEGVVPRAGRAGAASVAVVTPAGSAALEGGYRYARHLPRGDLNGDLKVNVLDAALIVRFAFFAEKVPVCSAVGDLTGDLKVTLADAVFLMDYLFARGKDPDGFFVDCD